MKKKFFVISTLLIGLLLISTSYAFANTNMVNTVEHAVQNVTSATGNVINRGIGTTRNAVNSMEQGTQNVGNAVVTGTTNNTAANNRTSSYNATRTNANTFLGMTSTAWTWLIMGIVAVAIVTLVWFYARQKDTSTHSNE